MGNLELVQRSYEAFARDDMDGVVADMHAAIEWHQAQGLPHGGLYRGLDEVRRNVFDPLDADWWDEFSAEPDEFLDAGSEVVVLGRYRGVAKADGQDARRALRPCLDDRGRKSRALPAVPGHRRVGRGAEPGRIAARDLIIDTCWRGVEDSAAAAGGANQRSAANV